MCALQWPRRTPLFSWTSNTVRLTLARTSNSLVAGLERDTDLVCEFVVTGKKAIGRLTFELYADTVPLTADASL